MTAAAAVTFVGKPVVGVARQTRALVEPMVPDTVAELTDDLAREVEALLDPGPRRQQRRVLVRGNRIHAEVKGLRSDGAEGVAKAVTDRLGRAKGVRWHRVNAATGRVTVAVDSARFGMAQLEELLSGAERLAGTESEQWSRHFEDPSDREPVLTSAIQLAGDIVGLGLAVVESALPTSTPAHLVRASVALVDGQPALREALEKRLGRSRADTLIAAGNALGQALDGQVTGLVADSLGRTVRLVEATARYSRWRQWEDLLGEPHHPGVYDYRTPKSRPAPLPPGPVERCTAQLGTGSALVSLATLTGGRGTSDAADAVVAGVPKAARAGRETFAGTLATIMSTQGVLTLDPQLWRRLDRASALVVDRHAVRGDRPVVLAAEPATSDWSTEHVWSVAQRLLWRDGDLPIPPPRGRHRDHMGLVPEAHSDSTSQRRTDSTAADGGDEPATHEGGTEVNPTTKTDQQAAVGTADQETPTGVANQRTSAEQATRQSAPEADDQNPAEVADHQTATETAEQRETTSPGTAPAGERDRADRARTVAAPPSNHIDTEVTVTESTVADAQHTPTDEPAANHASSYRTHTSKPAPAEVDSEQGEPRWHELREGDRVVGRVLIGWELHPEAVGLLAAARKAGLRVVLIGDDSTAELRRSADEFVAAGGSTSGLVRRLQKQGHVVAVLSGHAHKALAVADLGIGLAERDGETVRVPWQADVVCPDLRCARRIVAAAGTAREVSERGRVLTLSAATLSGLLLASGPMGSRPASASSPLATATLLGFASGLLAGRRAGREDSVTQVPLVPWHALEPDEVSARLPAPEREAPQHGPVVTEALRATHWLASPAATFADLAQQVRKELSDPLTPLLAVGAVASALLGSPTDAVLVGSVLGLNAVVSAMQRRRAGQSLHRLLVGERLLARRVTDDGEIETPAEELLPGDVIVLRNGDVVPADARLIETDGLEMDESGLTGESVTVDKQTAATPGAALGDRACMVFEGGVVVNGSARAVVVAVGSATEAGRALAVAGPPRTGGVQEHLRSLSERVLPLTLGGGSLVTATSFLRGLPLRPALADGLAVAVAAVPEGLPLVATVAQLAATRRLSRRGVLVRSSRTIEALGRLDTVCFDKTGTLTAGRLHLEALADLDETWDTDKASDSPQSRRLLRAAARACPHPEDGPLVHATDRAVVSAADATLGPDAAHTWDPIEEIPFESNRGYAAAVGHTAHHIRLAVKGAPEVLLPRCTQVLRGNGEGGRTRIEFTREERAHAEECVQRLAERGLRVLVVARRDFPSTPDDVIDEIEQLTLLGFIGLADTPRPQTRDLVKQLTRTGISVRMITGDHPVTARAVAEQLGIPADTIATGSDIDKLDEDAQAELIDRATVFARVSPEHKVRIVTALQKRDHVVAMTGDGSNDAAAIRTADIGIGLAARGSVAAREAADLIITGSDEVRSDKDRDDARDANGSQRHGSAESERQCSGRKRADKDGIQRQRAERRGGLAAGSEQASANAAGRGRESGTSTTEPEQATAESPGAASGIDLTVLLSALVEGRGMWQRVRDAIGVLVGGNAGEVAFTVLGTMVSGRAPIGTRQFLLVNLLTDLGPAMAVALSGTRTAEDNTTPADTGDTLRELPEPELGGDFLRAVAIRGAYTTAGAGAAWILGRATGRPKRAETMALAALICTQLGQTLMIGRNSPLVWATVAGSTALLAAIIMTPGVNYFFGCVPLGPVAWSIVGGCAVAGTVGAAYTGKSLA